MLASLLMSNVTDHHLYCSWAKDPSIFPGGGYDDLRWCYETCKTGDIEFLSQKSPDLRLNLKSNTLQRGRGKGCLQGHNGGNRKSLPKNVSFFGTGSDCGCWFHESAYYPAVCEVPSRRARFTSNAHATYLDTPCDGSRREEDAQNAPDFWGRTLIYPSHRQRKCEWPVPAWVEKDQGINAEGIESKSASQGNLKTLGLVFPITTKRRKKANPLPLVGLSTSSLKAARSKGPS